MPDTLRDCPFRGNLAMHEARCQSLERELLEALDRRDWHAAIVLPNNCGEPDRRGQELRRLLRGGQAPVSSWWQRFKSWFGRWTRDSEQVTRSIDYSRPPPGGTGIQSRVQVLAQAELQRLDSLAQAGLRIVSDNSGPASATSDGTGRTGPLRPFPQPPPARVVR